MKPKVIAVVGPTSSGKSALGVWLAKQIKKDSGGAEIISADSRQVYKGLNIGTGKITKKEMACVPHHLLDVANPQKQFTVDDFVKQAEKSLYVILQKHKIPIVVGGTGLYADTLLGRMTYPNVPPNQKLREQLEQKTTKQLFARLKKLDPRRAKTIEPKHKRRLIRAIEIAMTLGKSPVPSPEKKYDVLWLGLNPGEKILRKKICMRLFARIRAGMMAEAKKLHRAGLSYKRMEEIGFEQKLTADILRNIITREQFVERFTSGEYKYAKRQMRWFKRNPDIVWVKSKSEALRLSKKFLA